MFGCHLTSLERIGASVHYHADSLTPGNTQVVEPGVRTIDWLDHSIKRPIWAGRYLTGGDSGFLLPMLLHSGSISPGFRR